MILIALCVLQKQIIQASISGKSGELLLALALRVGPLHCLLLMRVQPPPSVATRPTTARHPRGSCIAEPRDGLKTMTTMEQAMTTLATAAKPPSEYTGTCTPQALAAIREILVNQRFICTFDDSGRPCLTPLPPGPLYLATDIPAAIEAGSLPHDLLLAILEAAAIRLGVSLPGGFDE